MTTGRINQVTYYGLTTQARRLKYLSIAPIKAHKRGLTECYIASGRYNTVYRPITNDDANQSPAPASPLLML